MRSALYYPDATVTDVELVKSALLLWDRLEFMVPYEGFEHDYTDPLVEEAMELVGVAHIPSHDEKTEAHAHIEDLVTRTLPPKFYVRDLRTGNQPSYELYPQKLLDETWRMLVESGVIGKILSNADYPTTEPAGLTIMSILADCCAGTTRSRVTDLGPAYATLADAIGSNTIEANARDAPVHENATSQLVPISLSVINSRALSLRQLIDFRKREHGNHGSDYTQLRHRRSPRRAQRSGRARRGSAPLLKL